MTRRMKIAYIWPYPFVQSGATLLIIDLAEFMLKHADVYIIAPQAEASPPYMNPDINLELVRGEHYGCQLLHSIKPDIIHHHGSKSKWLFEAISDWKRVIGTEHAYASNKTLPHTFIKPICGDHSNKIRHGVDLDMFCPSDSDRRPGPWRWGIAGLISSTKMCYPFMQALKKYKGKSELYIAGATHGEKGNENFKDDLERMSRVQLMGMLARELMPSFYELIDVLLFPTQSESVGLVAIEAMACGVPVLASDVDGLKETLNGGGLLFHDYEKMLQAADELQNTPLEYERLCTEGRERAVRDFDIKRMRREYLEAYKEMCGLLHD